MAESRILKEIEEIYREPLDYITAGPIDDDNIYHWEATIYGPEDSDYKNGVFLLDIKIPKDYPFKPPICKFKTKIYHPNINPYNGNICVNILKDEKWNPSSTISNILLSILVLLNNPNFTDPWNNEAKKLYEAGEKDGHIEYKKKIQEWIKEYSGKETFKE